MNKLKYVVYGTAIIFVAIIGATYYHFKNLGYYYENQSGDATLMDNIGLATTLTGSMSQFDITLDNHKLSYEIHDNTHTLYKYSSYESNGVNQSNDFVLDNEPILDETTKTINENGSSYENGVEQKHYVTSYTQPSVKAIYKFENNQKWPPTSLLALEDDITYYSNEAIAYQYNLYDDGKAANVSEAEQEGYHKDNESSTLNFENDEAIFMTNILPNMEGTAGIYHIKRTREDDKVVALEANKLGELSFELGTSAILKVSNEQIFLMKICEEKFTIDVYTKDFQLIQSLTYPDYLVSLQDNSDAGDSYITPEGLMENYEITYDNFKNDLSSMRILHNDMYTILMIQDPTSYLHTLLYVYDDATYQLLDQYRIETATYFDDAIYQDGYLYTVEPVSIQCDNPDSGIISTAGNNRIIRTFKGKEQVYQGLLYINEEKLVYGYNANTFMPFYNNPTQFRRDE